MKIGKISMYIMIFLLLLLMGYGILLLNVQPLREKVESVFKGEISVSEIKGTCLELYNPMAGDPNIKEVEVDIKIIFTVHDFRNGYMWIKFESEGYDSVGDVAYGEVNTAKWKIHKLNGVWEIVDIKQDV